MNQKIFETQHRADELLREALAIWRKSVQNDFLEGIEEDPVFSLLMLATAYQENRFDSELEHLKTEVLEEYVQTLLPYGMRHAIPATAVVETALQEDVAQLKVDADLLFSLEDTGITFMPLLKTRAVNLSLSSVVRVDGKRWKVTLKSNHPVTDLSGFSFAIKGASFHSVTVSLKGKQLPLIKPWQYADLPLNEYFSVDSMLYNRQQVFNASSMAFDLFARQNVRMYCVRPCKLVDYVKEETRQLELVFEFSGISDDFIFGKQQLALNTVLLVNARLDSTTLSSQNPVYRVENGQLLHLIRPQEEEMFRGAQVYVRKVAADRFNVYGLLRLLRYLIDKYDTDYYAFQHIQGWKGDAVMAGLRNSWQYIWEKAKDVGSVQPGVYLMLQQRQGANKEDISLKTSFLTTDGSKVNESLNINTAFGTAYGFDNAQIRQIAPPLGGCDEVGENDAVENLTRYYVTTQDRIVTPADIKMFCINELSTRYGIGKNLVNDIRIDRRLRRTPHCCYEIVVDIHLADNPFVSRSFASRIPQVEVLLCKMIEVRSANVYPVQINIVVDK